MPVKNQLAKNLAFDFDSIAQGVSSENNGKDGPADIYAGC
jgi:hypothetical protein